MLLNNSDNLFRHLEDLVPSCASACRTRYTVLPFPQTSLRATDHAPCFPVSTVESRKRVHLLPPLLAPAPNLLLPVIGLYLDHLDPVVIDEHHVRLGGAPDHGHLDAMSQLGDLRNGVRDDCYLAARRRRRVLDHLALVLQPVLGFREGRHGEDGAAVRAVAGFGGATRPHDEVDVCGDWGSGNHGDGG